MSELAPCIVLPLDKVLAWGGFDDDETAARHGDAPREIAALLGLITTCAWSIDLENDRGDAWSYTARDDLALERTDAGDDRLALQLLDRGGLLRRIAGRMPAPSVPAGAEAFRVDPAVINGVLESGDELPRHEERELVRSIATVPERFTDLLLSIRGITRLTRVSSERPVLAGSITILDCGEEGVWLSQTMLSTDFVSPAGPGADLLRPMSAEVLEEALLTFAGDLADPSLDEPIADLLAELEEQLGERAGAAGEGEPV